MIHCHFFLRQFVGGDKSAGNNQSNFYGMAIKYNVIERGQPGVAGGGEKKFYASAVSDGEMTLNKLTKSIEKISTVSGADIRAVVYAMVDVMKDSLADGQIVRLGDLGSLRIGISSKPKG